MAHFGATLDHVVEETLYVLDVDQAFCGLGQGAQKSPTPWLGLSARAI
jgi:hypothetical protein